MVSGKIDILLVEDNPGDARLITEMLKDGGLRVNEVGTAERLDEAISIAKKKIFNVIILDLNLPDSMGLETLDRMIAATDGSVPVIILTGLSDEALGEALIGHGADDYLEKSDINAAKLSRAVRYAIERGRLAGDLRQSEEIFHQFMEHSPIYVFFKDSQIRSLLLSRNYEAMLGRPLSELLGKTMNDLFPSDLAKTMIADDLKILKEGKQVDIEEELNGRYYSTIKFPIIEDGKPKYLAGYTIDITESKLAASQKLAIIKELNAKNSEMAVLHTTAVDIVSLRESGGLYDYVVAKLHEITGAAAVTFGVYHPESREIRVERAELDRVLITDLLRSLGGDQLAEKGFPVNEDMYRDLIETPIRFQKTLSEATFGVVPPEIGDEVQKAQGIDRFIGIAYVVERELYGTSVLGFRSEQTAPSLDMLNSFASLTALSLRRIAAEDALLESKWNYRSLIESSPCIICKIKPDGTTVFVNNYVEKITGHSAEYLIGRNWWDVLYPGELRNQIPNLLESLASGDIHGHEMTLAARDGTLKTIQWDSFNNYKANGKIVEINGVGIDITERKQAENKLFLQLDELRRWQNVMLDREGRVIELKKEVNVLLQELGRKDKYGD